PLGLRFDLGCLQEELIRLGVPVGHVLYLGRGSARLSTLRATNRGRLHAEFGKNQGSRFDSARNNQERASSHSRSAARRLRPRISAASWCSKPAKYRSFTNAAAWAWCRSSTSSAS